MRCEFLSPVNVGAALCRGGLRYAAGVYNGDVGDFGRLDGFEAEGHEELMNLAAFVLVDFAAESIYRKSSHGMV